MPDQTETAPLKLGFLTILREVNGYLGGYLVTNGWGRPLEFRLTTAVQPNKVQQVLYGDTLERYLCADLIGKALHEKTATGVQLILSDTESALDLRRHVSLPVAWLPKQLDATARRESLECHPAFPGDREHVRELLACLDATLDLAEPFTRIREAIVEARKLGVTNRAA